MENTRKNWDQAAGNYQAVFRLGLNEYNAALLRFWHDTGMLFPGARVLDIGCGVGKYGTYLAELGYDVTLTDISGEMLRHASENMAKYQTPWAVYRCDFNEVTGGESVFAGGFDLALSTMSPAVHDAKTVRKMSAMSRGFCFLARFYSWDQPFRDQLMRELGMEPRRVFSDLKGDCASMIRAVSEAGFLPQTRYTDYCWADRRSPEQMADYMLRNYYAEDTNRDELYRESLRLARAHTGTDGLITDNVNTRVSWIYWKTEERT
ncbi:MAG: class I SAM-dependent methyltransferase [Oscillospiraceae bacterium]|nr:class I SAM-dependent methyltransferase [Oscillospiraceae bacterium]